MQPGLSAATGPPYSALQLGSDHSPPTAPVRPSGMEPVSDVKEMKDNAADDLHNAARVFLAGQHDKSMSSDCCEIQSDSGAACCRTISGTTACQCCDIADRSGLRLSATTHRGW